jgi:hypothetical protein
MRRRREKFTSGKECVTEWSEKNAATPLLHELNEHLPSILVR